MAESTWPVGMMLADVRRVHVLGKHPTKAGGGNILVLDVTCTGQMKSALHPFQDRHNDTLEKSDREEHTVPGHDEARSLPETETAVNNG